MFDPLRIAVVGVTGLVGRTLIERSVGREDIRILGVSRRELELPLGAKMELVVADPSQWGEVFKGVRPDVLICALGTTWSKAGRDETAFRKVDQDLVVETARAARTYNVKRMIAVSSAGADAASKNFYLRVKGEVERDLLQLGFDRLDIIRPGLLRGQRGHDRRIVEHLGIVFSPLIDLALQGQYRKYRSASAKTVADCALALALRKPPGQFRHEYDGITRAAHSLPQIIRDEG